MNTRFLAFLAILVVLCCVGAWATWSYWRDNVNYIIFGFFILLSIKGFFELCMARVAIQRVGSTDTIRRSLVKLVLWEICFGLAAVGSLVVHFTAYSLRPLDYLILFIGGFVGLVATFVNDIQILDEAF